MQHTGGRPITETQCDDPTCMCRITWGTMETLALSPETQELQARALLLEIVQNAVPPTDSANWLVADRLIVAARRLLQQKP